jgi:hypothetical protein
MPKGGARPLFDQRFAARQDRKEISLLLVFCCCPLFFYYQLCLGKGDEFLFFIVLKEYICVCLSSEQEAHHSVQSGFADRYYPRAGLEFVLVAHDNLCVFCQ